MAWADNVNFLVGVRDERHNKHYHTADDFANAAIISPDFDVSNLSEEPQNVNMLPSDLIPSVEENDLLTADMYTFAQRYLLLGRPQ